MRGHDRVAGASGRDSSTTARSTPVDFDLPPDPSLPVYTEVIWNVWDQALGMRVQTGRVPLVGGRFTVPDLVLAEGEYLLEAGALDAAGNVAFGGVTIVSDLDAPAVALVAPQDGEAVLTAEVAVDLNFAAATTLVAVNGAPDGRSFGAGFAQDALTLPLAFGANVFTLDLEAGGTAFQLSFTLFRVDALGAVRIESPADGALVNTAAVTVRGTVPRGTDYVEVNGIPGTIAPDGVAFEVAGVAVREGANAVAAVAFPFGQQAVVRVTRDTVPPELLLAVPEDGARLLDAEVAVAGLVSEAATVDVLGAAIPLRVETTARLLSAGSAGLGIPALFQHQFELAAVPLEEGANELTLRLSDRAGNVADTPWSLVRAAGALTLVDPADGSSVPALETALRFEVLDALTIDAVFVAGRRIAAFDGISAAAGLLTLGRVPLVPGPNEMRLVYHRAGQLEEILLAELTSTAAGGVTVEGTVTDASTGAPLGGALVTVTVDGIEIVVVTNPDGSYSALIPPGTFTVAVNREGFLTATGSGSATTGTVVVSPSLLPWASGSGIVTGAPTGATASRAAGTVTDQETGQPLDGVLVTVLAGSSSLSAITGADGRFAIEGIPIGPFDVVFIRAGYFPESFDVADIEAVEVALSPSLEPLPPSVTLVGTVTSGLTGSREPGVSVRRLGTEDAVLTDGQGRFVLLGVPLGAQTLRFEKSGFLDEFVTLEVLGIPGGLPMVRSFTYPVAEGFGGTLAIAPDAEGTVRDALSGVPLPGAEVRVGALSAIADASGHFAFSGLEPGTAVEVVATAPSYESQTETALVVVNGDDELSFALRPTELGAVAGVIRDASTGEPIRDAEVRPAGSDVLATGSDRDGEYTLGGLAPGAHVLEVRHPEYEGAQVAGIAVAPGVETPLDVALSRLPTSGRISGRITDAQTGAAVPGAVVALSPGNAATSDSSGLYALSPVPAGLVELSLTAPGYPETSRTVAVAADASASEPTLTTANLALAADGSAPDAGSAIVSATEGGLVTTADGRFTVAFPALSVTADARVTLRTPAAPPATPGALLDLDPDLGGASVRAIGRAIELAVEALVPGDPIPRLVGPAVFLARYAGAEVRASGVAEDTLFPYYYDGTRFTMLRTVPYLHVVDRRNKVVLVGLDFEATETGDPVAARMATAQPILLAQAGGGFPPFSGQGTFVFSLGAALLNPVPPRFGATYVDLGPHPAFESLLNPNSLPVLVVHGWDPSSILFDSDPVSPTAPGRYRNFIDDLIAGTRDPELPESRSVFRPIFLTYNTRRSIMTNGHELALQLRGKFLDGTIQGVPAPDNPGSGKFQFVDSFGFSMGGLVERAFQCSATYVQDMVSLASPHTGALDALVEELERRVDPYLQEAVPGLTLYELISLWSPGTADLLPDTPARPNLRMRSLNRFNACSRPRNKIQLVGGDDPIALTRVVEEIGDDLAARAQTDPWLAGLIDAVRGAGEGAGEVVEALGPSNVVSVGTIATGEYPNDGVVTLRSARAEERSGSTVPILAPVVNQKKAEDFNHKDVGVSQRLEAFAQASIFPGLSDWTVATRNAVTFELPRSGLPGFVDAEVRVDYNAQHGSITGVALVVYGLDRLGSWHIVHGADRNSRVVHEPRSVFGTSSINRSIQLQTGRITIPEVTSAETDLVELTFLVVELRGGDATAPADPEDAQFGLP